MTDQASSVLVSVLRLDANSEERIHQAMLRLHRLLGRRTVVVSPHVSLIPTDFQDEIELLDRIQHLASSTLAFDIALSHLGWFPGGIAFLGATPSQSLLAFHQQCHLLSDASTATQWIDLYQPGAWVPHCTLAMGVPGERQADVMAEAFGSLELPIHAVCQSVELVRMDKDGTCSIGVGELRAA